MTTPTLTTLTLPRIPGLQDVSALPPSTASRFSRTRWLQALASTGGRRSYELGHNSNRATSSCNVHSPAQREPGSCSHHLEQPRRQALLALFFSSCSSFPVELAKAEPASLEAPPPASEALSPPVSAERRKPASQVVDFSDWFDAYGEGYALRVPPGFVDLMPPEEEDLEAQSTLLMQKKTKKSPFVSQFTSSDRVENITVLLQPATKLKLTFFEVDDISEFGSIDDAAKLFVSPEAKILARREYQAAWFNKRPRTYYLYEFVSGGLHVAMSLAASAGYVFVMGASAPQDKWKQAAARLRAAAGAFQLTV